MTCYKVLKYSCWYGFAAIIICQDNWQHETNTPNWTVGSHLLYCCLDTSSPQNRHIEASNAEEDWHKFCSLWEDFISTVMTWKHTHKHENIVLTMAIFVVALRTTCDITFLWVRFSLTSCVLSFRTNCDGARLMMVGSMIDRVCTSQKAMALIKAALEPVFLTHRQTLLTCPTAMSVIVAT